MPKQLHTTDIQGKLIVLGCGTSVGVPTIGCGCKVCLGGDPKNNRTRCSVILGLPEGNLLIDTAPDLRHQLIREQIGIVHSVLYTHEHADHLFGMDDLRLMQFYLGGPITIHCEEIVEERIRKSFDYAFKELPNMHKGAIPKIIFKRIGPTDEPCDEASQSSKTWPKIDILGASITAVRQMHGPNFESLGFRIGNVAYCTDLSEMPESSKAKLKGLDVLILDALRPSGHVTHLSIDQAVELANELGAKQVYLTHMSCEVDYNELDAELPEHISPAYDGLSIPLR